MDTNELAKLLNNLTPEEADAILSSSEKVVENAIKAEAEKVLSARKQKAQEEMVAQFLEEVAPVRGPEHLVNQIKRKYQQRGLDFDNVVFH